MTFTLFIGIRVTAAKKLTFRCKEIPFHIWIYVFCDDGWGDLGSERRSRSFDGGFCWIWGKVSVFFSSGQVEQSSTVIFHGRELHSVNRATHLRSPSTSAIAYTIRAALFGAPGNCPIFPVFTAPVIFTKWWLWYTLVQDRPSAPQPGLCAPSARAFLFLSVVFHKGHELAWSPVMGERALRRTEGPQIWKGSRPRSRSCVGSRLQSFFLLPARQSAGRHGINSDTKISRWR